MQRDSLTGAQVVLHVVIVVAGWVLFAYWWYIVAARRWDQSGVGLLILGTLLIAPALTAGWVLHNVGIFRRKGPRMGRPVATLEYTRDWNGRTIDADWAALADEHLITVRVDGPVKRYAADDADARASGTTVPT